MNLKTKDSLEICIEGVTHFNPTFLFCGELNNIFEFEGITICQSCYKEMSESKSQFFK